MKQSNNSKGSKHAFSIGTGIQWYIGTVFGTWTISYYFTALKLNISYLTLAFVIWSIWNAINDPLLGYLSDRTSTRWGRRKPYIIFGMGPLALISVVIWLAPEGQTSQFFYLLLMLILFDTFYTMIALPYDALFPELYPSSVERAQVNSYRQVWSIIALLGSFIIPGILIGDIDNPNGYLLNGIVTGSLILISLLISVKWGVRERIEYSKDYLVAQNSSFFQDLKITITNKGFVLYTAMYVLYNYLLSLHSTVLPLYVKEVLGVSDALATGELMGLMFIVGLISVGFWKYLDIKIGSRKAFFLSILLYMIPAIPLLFITRFIDAMITIGFVGVGFGGMLYFIYLLIADVIDEDELKSGIRREGAFFGVTNFFKRLSMIFSVLTINIVFNSTGWEQYTPNPGVDVVNGLRILVLVFPGIALILMMICLRYYPFSQKRVIEIQNQLNKIHQEKLEQIKKIE